MAGKPKGKLSPEEFTLKAIDTLRKPGYKGIHSVYSGFNQAFREYFGTDPVVATKELAGRGIIATQLRRGGAMLYRPEDAPSERDQGAKALATMGL